MEGNIDFLFRNGILIKPEHRAKVQAMPKEEILEMITTIEQAKILSDL